MSEQAVTKRHSTLEGLLESRRDAIQKALPRHLHADRMIRMALMTVNGSPMLARCTKESLIGCIMRSVQLGLEPDNGLGHCYLVPFKNRKRGGVYEAQFIIGYRGLLHLARQSGQILSINAVPVFEGEEFEEWTDENGMHFRHVPADVPQTPDALRAVFLIAKFRDGGHHYGRMWRWEVDAIRDRSRAKNDGPWMTDYIEMAKKTITRRECKYLPLSTDVQRQLMHEERGEIGAHPITLDMPSTPEPAAPPPTPKPDAGDDGALDALAGGEWPSADEGESPPQEPDEPRTGELDEPEGKRVKMVDPESGEQRQAEVAPDGSIVDPWTGDSYDSDALSWEGGAYLRPVQESAPPKPRGGPKPGRETPGKGKPKPKPESEKPKPESGKPTTASFYCTERQEVRTAMVSSDGLLRDPWSQESWRVDQLERKGKYFIRPVDEPEQEPETEDPPAAHDAE